MTEIIKIFASRVSAMQAEIVKIDPYRSKLTQIGNVSKPVAPMLINDFIFAYDMANYQLARAEELQTLIANNLKATESMAYMDRAKAFLESKTIKDSADARNRYVSMDPECMELRDLGATASAMVTIISNNMTTFRQAIDAVKRVAYDNSYMSPTQA